MRPSSRDGFAIAIICALTLEAEAVEALFDETYDRLSEFYKKQPGDDNVYLNGRIGNHNVVLCCMPRMGKGNAASVAASLKISYRRIQVALVVGICGGAPCTPEKEEIFLGDVIISDAVIEYDFGRQYRGGFARKTGVQDTLGRPNREIQSLLAGLRPQQSRRDIQAKALRHLQAIQESQPRWCQPSSAEDVLYEASYQHKHYSSPSLRPCLCLDDTFDEVCPTALDTTCIILGCAGDRICRRRHCTENCSPTIQIGTVASADTVMKSGEHRDSLVKSEGVIGFEMEGAGVWNNISCIIIKGVCDYADSHKNKAWQAYAAATGAATAKAFLEYWEPIAIEEANEFYIPLDLTTVPAIEEFIGREDELDCLWEYLKPAVAQTRKVAVLHGLGGIGKTQLAIHFARKHKSDFTSIFWLSGKDQSSLVSSLSSCLSRIQGQPVNVEATSEEEAEQRARQALQWLAMPGNTRWLIIFDNIDQYSPLEGDDDSGYDVYKFFPQADHGSIIITSRLQELTELGKPFPVQKLAQTDATKLLMQSSGFSAEDITRMGANQDINDLAARLDGLSLAIVIAGAFMRQTSTNVREYLELYRTSWFDLQSQSEPTRHYQQGNIIQTWLITYKEVQKQDPTAANLLLLLAFFDNQDIWYELIESGTNCFDPPSWFEVAVASKLIFKTKLKLLIKFSLVETKQQEGSYTLHPVVQEWCCHIAASNKLTKQLQELAFVSVGYMVPSSDVRDYARLEQRLLPHANSLTQRGMGHWLDISPEEGLEIFESFNGLGILYFDQGKLKEAEEMYQQALAGKEKALGPDHTSTLETVNNLGRLYMDQGKLKEAEEMYQQALAGYKKVLGLNHLTHPPTLNTVNNLGILYKDQGKLKEAEEMYQQALTGYKKALGPGHISTLETVNNLGVLYMDQGKLKEAEETYQQALAGYKKALGLNHLTYLPALHTANNLGILYEDQGKLKEAEEMYQQALAGYKKVLGLNHLTHPPTLNTVNNLGILYKDQGKLKEAEEMYQQALAGKEKVLGPDHISTLETVNNLGILYKDQGKLKEAEEIYQQALIGYKKALGPGHTSTLNTINSLGFLYYKQGKLEKAEEMYQQALAGYKKNALDPGHISILHTVNNLGLLYMDQGKLKEAEEMYQQALAGKEKALGPDHTTTLDTVSNLGILYMDQGKLKEAEGMYQRALAGYKKALGLNYLTYLPALGTTNNLGNLYEDQGKLKEAEEMYQQALAGYKKVLGLNHLTHPPTLNTVNNLGILYKDQGKLKEAEEMYQQALAGKEKALGPDHTSTLETVNNLGVFYKNQGKLNKAEEMYQQALTGYKKALGPGHISTLHIVKNLGNLYMDQGKLEEAEEMYQQALTGYEKVLGPDHSKTCMVADNLASLAGLHAQQDTPCHIQTDPSTVQTLRQNTLADYSSERPRKRDKLYRLLRR